MVTADPKEAAGRLDADRLLADVAAQCGLDDFGDVEIADKLRAYLAAINTEADLSPQGAMGLEALVRQLLTNRLRFHADLARHPEILDEDVSDPIIITGLFRTGTTKLQRMLSADPSVQPLTFWRIFNPAPFPDAVPGEPDPRIAVARGYVDNVTAMSPEFMAGHPWIADDADEDSLLLWLTFDHLANASVGHVPSFVSRVRARPAGPSYRYLADVLRYLQWQDGAERGLPSENRSRRGRPWVLKSPTHIGNLTAIFEAFPRATLVHCHRDPVVVVPSFARLFELFWGLFGNQVDPKRIGAVLLELWSAEMARNLEQRAELGPDARIVDVRFDDIVADPIRVIRGITDAHGHQLSDDADERMLAWDKANPADLYGKHEYSLQACGMTAEQITEAFGPYITRFGL
jgi:hypothetical protein